MRPIYLDTDCQPPDAIYVQVKQDGWGVEITVADGLHTVRVARSGRVLWTERAPGADGTYWGEWLHGTQRSLSHPLKGRIELYDAPTVDGDYSTRYGACVALSFAHPAYLTSTTWTTANAPTWDDVVAAGHEGLIYRDDDPSRLWRRKVQVELDCPVLAVEPTRIAVRLPCGEAAWVSSGLSSTLRPRVGQEVRITGAQITRAGRVFQPVIRGVKEGV